jgi:small subunit ribosomal protein S9
LVKNLAYGTGRRKTAVARVFLREGDGKITVNGKTPEEYFPTALQAANIKKALEVTDSLSRFNVLVTVSGGGTAGQSDACKHGIARALKEYDDSNRPVLRANGLLTRDSRMVERKKYGQRGARRRFQFSKR